MGMTRNPIDYWARFGGGLMVNGSGGRLGVEIGLRGIDRLPFLFTELAIKSVSKSSSLVTVKDTSIFIVVNIPFVG
jgi:hypothetical protein